MEIFWTVLTALIILIFSQFILKFIFEPIVEHRKIIGKMISELKFYKNVILNPPQTEELKQEGPQNNIFSSTAGINFRLPDKYLDARKILRKLAGDFEASYKIISCKKSLIYLKVIINLKNKNEIVESLIYLSNITGVQNPENINLPQYANSHIEEIYENLKL